MVDATALAAAPKRGYTPRAPQDFVLVQLLSEHLDHFIEATQAEDPEWRLPELMESELRAIVNCGDFTNGFTRMRCDACSAARVVPFSCESRTCPSCAGRRMNNLAAHLVDRVLLSSIPYRQWVLTLPWTLRRHAAFDSRLANAITSSASDVLLAWLRACAREDGVLEGQPTGIVHLQRFGDAADLNLHPHFVLGEGVFVSLSPEEVRFHRTRAPRDEDVQALVCEIERRVARWLARHESDGAGSRSEGALVLLHLSADLEAPGRAPEALTVDEDVGSDGVAGAVGHRHVDAGRPRRRIERERPRLAPAERQALARALVAGVVDHHLVRAGPELQPGDRRPPGWLAVD